MTPSPTARSIRKLRDHGYFIDTCERWIRFPDKNKAPCTVCKRPHMIQIRRDYCGFADLIAFKPGTLGCMAIQATDLTSVSKHVHKVQGMDSLTAWLNAGNTFYIFGWGKKGPAGKRKTYQLRVVDKDGNAIDPDSFLPVQETSQSQLPQQSSPTKPDVSQSGPDDQLSLSFQ